MEQQTFAQWLCAQVAEKGLSAVRAQWLEVVCQPTNSPNVFDYLDWLATFQHTTPSFIIESPKSPEFSGDF